MSLPALYILTDANGFTTATEPTQEAAFREAGRVPLLAPITVHRWKLCKGLRGWWNLFGTEEADYQTIPIMGWVMEDKFLWNGSDATWR